MSHGTVTEWVPVSVRIPLTVAQELIRMIRLLALAGKSQFLKYLRQPLTENGYHSGQIQDSVLKLTERIAQSIKDPTGRSTIGHKIRLLISRALGDTPSALGDAIIFLLEQTSINPFLATEMEMIRLVNVVGPSLYKFHALYNEHSLNRFENTLRNTAAEDIAQALEPVNLGSAITKVELDHRIRNLYSQILIASRKNDLERCRKLIAEYMIRYCDQEVYDEEGVNKIIKALEKREEGFTTNLRNLIAVQLYYQITKSITRGDMKSAIIAIRKYAHIFEGDNTVRFFFEIDRMERVLYKILKEKNLWKHVRGNSP